jgi:hypothetical protein
MKKKPVTKQAAGKDTPLDTEADRQSLIEEFNEEDGPSWEDQCKPGSYGCHELLDRTAFVADAVERLVRSHPACVRDPEWFALAERAAAALHELYQRVGAEHLSAKGEPCPTP